MNVLKLKYGLITVAALLLFQATMGHTQFDPVLARLDSLEAGIDSLSAVHDSLAEVRAGMLVRSSELSARIDELRGEPGDTPGPLDKYRLNSALAASQSLAEDLDRVSARLDSLQQAVDGHRLDAVALCTAALDSLSRVMRDSHAAPRSALALRFETLRERRQRIAAVAGGDEPAGERPASGRVSLAELAGLMNIGPQDSPEEIAEKSAFLSDIEDRWKRALEALEHNIGRLDEEREMRNRMGEFTQELALFDETGPSSRAAVSGQETEQSDETALQPGTIVDRNNGFGDFSVSPKEMAETIALDIQIADPETELRLMQELDRFSSGDIADLVELLQARRDSLAADLASLRRMNEQLREKAGLD